MRVYTPYLNRIVVDLLKHAPAGIVEKSVITDLSPTSSAVTYRDQLLAVRRLLNEGIEVRTQPRLHAKVLLIDGAQVTVGSQNFTSYARSCRVPDLMEALVCPRSRLRGTRDTPEPPLNPARDTAPCPSCIALPGAQTCRGGVSHARANWAPSSARSWSHLMDK